MLPEIGTALAAGIALGWVLAWALGRSRQQQEKQRANVFEAALKEQTDREAATNERLLLLEKEKARLEERLTAEKNALEQARNSLSDTFSALARKALSENNESFLAFAKTELGKQQQSANSTLEAKEQAITTLLKPVGEALERLQTATQQLETKREGAYQKVLAEIGNIQETHQSLRRETTQLIQALRAPKARGNWGELQLKRCVEFAGMVEHASFKTEAFVRESVDDEAIKPDCIIYLPNERTIVIDVKTPFDAFLEAMNATDEVLREKLLTAHATRVRQHLSQLSAKAYWKQFKDSPDFVVCFLPSEVLFSAALEQDPNLIEFGSKSSVILATPTTLIALLKAVAFGWQQMEVTRNAEAIKKAGERLYDKLANTQDYFLSLGKALDSAVRQYNSLIGCIEGRGSVFKLARDLRELGIRKDQGDLAEVQPLESATRDLKGEDWVQPGLSLAAKEEEPEDFINP